MKQAIIGIVIIAVIGIGAAVYLTQQPSNQSDTVEVDDVDLRPETEIGSFTGTVSDLLRNGQDLTCTFNQTETGSTVAGTVYVAGQGQRIRGDFTLNQPDGLTMNGHIVRNDGFNYFWSDQLDQGTKTPVDENDTPVPSEDNQSDVLDERLEYNCQRWSVDNGMFQLPNDKEFVDITQQIQQIDDATDQVQDAQCAACDQIQGPGREQCRQALGC